MKRVILGIAAALCANSHAVFFDLEPNNSLAQAQVINRPASSFSDLGFMSLGQAGDVDVLQIQLYAGENFIAVTTPTQDNQQLVPDTRMALLDELGVPLMIDDDGGPGQGSRVEAQIFLTGTYYIAIAGYDDPFFEGLSQEQGTYTLSVLAVPEIPAWLGLLPALILIRRSRKR